MDSEKRDGYFGKVEILEFAVWVLILGLWESSGATVGLLKRKQSHFRIPIGIFY